MRFYEFMSEAPMADLALNLNPVTSPVNDIEQSDLGILQSEKGIAKIYRAFDHTPYMFNVYVIAEKNRGFTNKAIPIPELEQLIGRPVKTEGRITIIYTNNITNRQNRIPMNAWTLAHRIIHALQIDTSLGATRNDYLRFDKTIWGGLVDICNFATNIQATLNKNYDLLNQASPQPDLISLSHAVLTMKSARDRRITNALDLGGEVLAQYLLTGRVKYNDAETTIRLIPEVLKRPDWRHEYNRPPQYLPTLKDNIDVDQMQHLIDDYTEQTELSIDRTLSDMVGKVFQL